MDYKSAVKKIVDIIEDNPLYWQPAQLVVKAERMGLSSKDSDEAVIEAWCKMKSDCKEQQVRDSIKFSRKNGIITYLGKIQKD